MTTVVRVPRRVYKQALLNTHYESYLKVLPNDTTKFVPGAGDVMADLVIIGEAPGEEEERLGLPFVGKSGNLLSKYLKTIGLVRSKVFITNLVKHRPPKNADPTQAQASAARQLMRWEIGILRPKVVVTLGKFATEVFYPNPSMQNLSGTSRRKEMYNSASGVLVIPIYHPAAALRNSSVRLRSFKDFQAVRQALET